MNDSIQNSFIQTSLDWIKENYLKIIFVFLLLSSIFGWILYQSYIQEKNSKEASILFDEFNSLLNNENIDFEKLNSIEEETKENYPDQIYSILMNLEISELNFNSNNFEGSLDKLREAYLDLEKKGDEVSFLRDLSRLKYSLLLISQSELNEAIEVLSKDFIFFNELKYEFLGDAQMESLNILEAKKNYQIALDISSSEIHKELIKIKLSTIKN
jgi:predicted negative regulator of RcsB-dependent stress response